VGRESKPKQCR